MLSSLILNFVDWDYKNDNSSDKRRYKSEVQTKWIENFKQLHVRFTGVQGCLELWAVKGGKFKLLTLWSWLFFWLFRKDFKINHIRQECGLLLKHFVATVRWHTKISLVEQKSFVHKNIFFYQWYNLFWRYILKAFALRCAQSYGPISTEYTVCITHIRCRQFV